MSWVRVPSATHKKQFFGTAFFVSPNQPSTQPSPSHAQPSTSRTLPTSSHALPTSSRTQPSTSRAQPSPSRALPSTSRLHPSPYSGLTAIVPARRGSTSPRLEHIPAKLEDTLAKLEGTLAKLEGVPAKLEGISTQLLTTSGDAHRTIRASVSDETRIRSVRYVHPRRPIRASNDGHGVAELAHNQCLADR